VSVLEEPVLTVTGIPEVDLLISKISHPNSVIPPFYISLPFDNFLYNNAYSIWKLWYATAALQLKLGTAK